MFDPHRTRYNDRRYYTRKGQVIQAKRTDVPFNIEPNKVDAYKRYILKNHLITSPPPPPTIITIDSISSSAAAQPYPTNLFPYSGEQGREVHISELTPPRILITIKEQANDYLIVIFMYGNQTTAMVDPLTYYIVLGLNGQTGDYDIKFLSGGQKVFSIQDQVAEFGDNTTFLLPKSLYSISLPA